MMSDEMVNIMQVDVEDWFCDLRYKQWRGLEERVEQNTERLLELFERYDVQATFFVLGDVAERHPNLLERMKEKGHEIASHGYSHRPLRFIDAARFEEDLMQSMTAIEKATGEKVRGFRAPQFSITDETAWAIACLTRHGFVYDSSIFPAKTPLYGFNGAPLMPYRIDAARINAHTEGAKLWEVPLSVVKVPGFDLYMPGIGGFYFRSLPYGVTRKMIGSLHREARPAVFFIHPWEIDPALPRHRELGFTHYLGNRFMEEKLSKLMEDFRFVSTEKWLQIHKES